MTKTFAIVLMQVVSAFAFAADPQFYVFDKNTEKVAFCKTPPPPLFQFKKLGDNKLTTSAVSAHQEAYEEGFAAFMDLDVIKMVESGTKPPKECWVIDTAGFEFPILVSGIEKGKSFPYFPSLVGPIKPGTSTERKLNGVIYTLAFPQFDKLNADGTVKGMKPKDVTLKTNEWTCVLASPAYLDDKEALQLILAADLNSDTYPDVLLDTVSKGTSYSIVMSQGKSRGCKPTPAIQGPPGD